MAEIDTAAWAGCRRPRRSRYQCEATCRASSRSELSGVQRVDGRLQQIYSLLGQQEFADTSRTPEFNGTIDVFRSLGHAETPRRAISCEQIAEFAGVRAV